MKKLEIFTIFVICFLLVLASCGAPPSLPEAPSSTPTTTPEPTPESTPSSTPTSTGELKVHFIDVGQGDSILIDLEDTEILIDGGDKSPGVVSYLNDYVDGALEIMVATHPHADHIGGLIAALDAFEVEEIWLNGDSSTSKTYDEFMDAIQSEDAVVNIGKQGDKITVGELSLIILNPVTLDGTTNNNSIVLFLQYGNIGFSFTGDAEQEAEAAMLVSGVVPDVEILKVGHHGSRTASSQDFLATTSPEVAIYMAGEGNSYGHPHEEAIIALTDIGAEIYGTDIHGTIVVTTDGEVYDLQLEKQASPVTSPSSPPPTDTSEEPPPASTPTPTVTSNVEITRIFYDGLVYRVESDEYVEITNLGAEPQDLAGWVLRDISEGYPSFIFPSYILQPGESVRVYTNEIHPEYGGFSFGSGKAVWNNSDPDVAALFDAQGQEVSRKSY